MDADSRGRAHRRLPGHRGAARRGAGGGRLTGRAALTLSLAGALGAGSWACHGSIGGSTSTRGHDAGAATDGGAPGAESGAGAGGAEATGGSPSTGDHVGDACLNRAGVDVRTFVCVGGLTCDSTTMLCEAAHTGPLGKNCVGDDECASGHCASVCCTVACPLEGGCGSQGACAADGQGCVVAAAGAACDVDGGASGSICLDPHASLLIAGSSCDGLGACQPRGHTTVCADTTSCDPATGVCADVASSDGGRDGGSDADAADGS